MSELCVVCGKPEEGHFQDTPDDMGCGRFGKYLPPSAIVLAWLGRPEVAERLARWSDGASVLAALRQLAEEGK